MLIEPLTVARGQVGLREEPLNLPAQEVVDAFATGGDELACPALASASPTMRW